MGILSRVVLAATVVLLLHVPVSAGKLSMPDRVLLSLVAVTHPDDDPHKQYVCTGFITNAAAGEVVTALHCITEDEESIYVDGEPSLVLRYDTSYALLKIHAMRKPPLEIGTKPPKLTDRVMSFGYANGYMQTLSRGVSRFWEHGWFAVDGPLVPGMSGGPIVDMDGRVVGMNQASDYAIGVASGVESLRAFLRLPNR
jgi:S1-C subfamily serine protease